MFYSREPSLKWKITSPFSFNWHFNFITYKQFFSIIFGQYILIDLSNSLGVILILNHLSPMHSFLYPLRESRENVHWEQMGWNVSKETCCIRETFHQTPWNILALQKRVSQWGRWESFYTFHFQSSCAKG